jgi:DNA polymerase III subunit alpha
MGQMSLFGAHTGVVEEIVLPPATGEISRREVLNWERELIGLYVSDHPLRPIMNELTQAVSHFSGQLSEAVDKERVRVAGLIVRIRHHQSKAGKPMGFVTLEDLQGTIELVIFPRTWTQYADVIRYDTIVLVDGKMDMAGAEPKVLVDSLTTEFKMTTSLDPQPVSSFGGEFDWPEDDDPDSPDDSALVISPPVNHRVSEMSQQIPDQASEIDEWEDGPPPPESFPPDSPYNPPSGFQNHLQPDLAGRKIPADDSLQEFLTGETAVPAAEIILAEQPSAVSELDDDGRDNSEAEPPVTVRPVSTEPFRLNVQAGETSPATVAAAQKGPSLADPMSESGQPESLLKPPAFLASPAIQSEDSGNVHMITVVLRSTGDKTRDVLRLRRIHGIITSYPGNDRFSFHVFERGRGYLLEFPNFTAGYCPELMHRLTSLVGPENMRAEPIPIL